GGGSTATSTSGGGVAKSTESGGGSAQTSAAGGDHRHAMFSGTGFAANPNPGNSTLLSAANGLRIHANSETSAAATFYTEGSSGNHSHSVTIPAHSHSFDVPNHSHNVTIQNHSHNVTIPSHQHDIDIPAHQHDITLPNHTHEIEHGIFKLGRTPSRVTIKVDGNTVPHTATTGDSINLIPYLALDSENRVQRGWHTVEILPNDLGRINAEVMTQFFMQSRGGVDA